MENTDFNPSKNLRGCRREVNVIDEFLDQGLTPEQIMEMAQSREKERQEEKTREANIRQLENKIKIQFVEYLDAVGAEDLTVSDLKLDDLFSIIKGKFKFSFGGLTKEEYQTIREELRKELRNMGVEV